MIKIVSVNLNVSCAAKMQPWLKQRPYWYYEKAQCLLGSDDEAT